MCMQVRSRVAAGKLYNLFTLMHEITSSSSLFFCPALVLCSFWTHLSESFCTHLSECYCCVFANRE